MSKVFISSDIEGVADISTWDETEKGHPDYAEFRQIMTDEVGAICKALEGFAKDVIVRDSHDSAKNIIHERLPLNTKMIYEFNGHIDQMMFGLDGSFDFAVLHGYHAAAGTGDSPLAHTECRKILAMTINGKSAGEVTLSVYTAAMYGVPVCFICGDESAVNEAVSLNPYIIGTVTKSCEGQAIIAKHPSLVLDEIKSNMTAAVKGFKKNPALCRVALPEHFKVEVAYKEHTDAYRASFYPKVKAVNPNSVIFESDNFIEVLAFVNFCM